MAAEAPAKPVPSASRVAILVLIIGYLLLPLFAMLEFSTRGDYGSRSLRAFADILSYPDLIDSIILSLEIAALTVLGMLLLLVPTMIWTVVRVPRMRRVVEFLCLLPLAIPAIVIVVGISPIYRWMGQTRGRRRIASHPRPHRHHPGPSVRVPRDRCEPARHRRRDARRGGPQPRRGLAARDLPGHPPEHPPRDPGGVRARDRAGPG